MTNGFLFCHSPLQAHKANLKGKNDRMTKCKQATCARKNKIIEVKDDYNEKQVLNLDSLDCKGNKMQLIHGDCLEKMKEIKTRRKNGN